MLDQIKNHLIKAIDPPLVEALLKAYSDLKNNYYLGKYKPSELEGGHFAEVAIRILELVTTGRYTPLGQHLPKFDLKEVEKYAQLPSVNYSDSIRIHIPRAILAIYGIRNRRGVGHVGGDITPNLSDSTFVVATCDWILVELIRLYYTSSLEEAQKLVDTLVVRKVPLIQDFNGFLKVLDPSLSVPKQILVLLYQRGNEGALREELSKWVKTSAENLSNALSRLVNSQKYLHYNGSKYFITRAGEIYIEEGIYPRTIY